MASYAELRSLFNDSNLRNKVTASVVIAAETELKASPGTADGRSWALDVLNSPEVWGRTTYMLVLAVNKASPVATIQGASDATIQTNVDAVVADLIAARAGV